MPNTSLYKQKPTSCDGCPWQHISRGYAPGHGDPNAKLWVIAESLGETEAIQGIPLVGYTGKEFDRDLIAGGIRRHDIYADNVVRCFPPPQKRGQRKIPQDIINFCSERHVGTILSTHRPNAIIALGDYSLQFLTGKSKITKQRGSIVPGLQGIKVVPTIHHAAIAHSARLQVLRPFIRFDIAKAIEQSKFPEYIPPVENFNISPTIEEIENAVDEIISFGSCSVDIEHAGGMDWNALLLCIGFYWSEKAICIPFFGYRAEKIWTDSEFERVINAVDKILSCERVSKTLQNGNSDVLVLESHGFKFNGFREDTMLKHHVIVSERGVAHTLAFIGSVHSDVPFYKDEVKGEETFALVDPKLLRTYNCRDVKVTGDSDVDMDYYLDGQNLRHVYAHDMALTHVIRRMMQRGILLDKNELTTYRSELRAEVDDIDNDLVEILGTAFNPASNKHMQNLLFGVLDLPSQGKTKSQAGDKVDFDTLLKLQDTLPLDNGLRRMLDLFMIRSQRTKILSTYLKDFTTDSSGALHTTYNQQVIPSGRLSSTKPNLMNLPRQRSEGKRVKRLFRSRPGHVFVSRDYSQIELILYGYAADDLPLISAIKRKDDLHTLSAMDLFRVSQPTGEQRDFAKIFHYGGILYGGGAETIRVQAIRQLLRSRQNSNVVVPTIKEIENLQFNWFAKHPSAAKFNAAIENQVATSNPRRIDTLILGRPRFFLIPLSDAKRAARSHVVSGTAADIINAAMIKLDAILHPDIHILLQIHDQLVFETPKYLLKECVAVSQEVMEAPVKIGNHIVSFKTDCEIGECLGEMEKEK